MSLIYLPAKSAEPGIGGKPFDEFSFLSNKAFKFLKQKSWKGKIAYLETAYL
jgi:hypothetical protein